MVSAVPQQPRVSVTSPKQAVKAATPDIIVFDEKNIPVEFMADLTFADMGSQEIIGVLRNDIVNGQQVSYSPVTNLTPLAVKYGPHTIFSLSSSQSVFNNYGLKLENYIPEYGVGTGPFIDESIGTRKSYYVDSNGNLVVNVTNMTVDEQVEIQVLTSGETTGDILY